MFHWIDRCNGGPSLAVGIGLTFAVDLIGCAFEDFIAAWAKKEIVSLAKLEVGIMASSAAEGVH